MAEVANAVEAGYWSGPSGQSWIEFETEQDRLLSEALDAVMARADLMSSGRVLDIGCGTGALSVAAAQRVGRGGRIVASDISAPMLARADERTRDLPQVMTHLADAETADWPEAGLDIALSRFGVMFFGNPPGAFANIARALNPGARMVFATWASVAKNVYWRDPARIAADRLGTPPAAGPNTPGPMGMADPDWSMAQLRAAGLTDVACEEVEIGLPIDGTPEEAAALALVIGPAARVVRLFEATETDRAVIRQNIARELEPYCEGNLVRIPAVINIYTARTV